MQLHSKAIAILIMFLFLMASVVTALNSNANSILAPDMEPPLTYLFYNPDTGYVTLTAKDYPLYHNSGLLAIYYQIDNGQKQTYNESFFIGEGTHTITYWSVDNNWNGETHKTAELTYGTTPPNVEITSPEVGGIYFRGNRLLALGDKTICIGKIQITVTANDGNGSGVKTVFFKFSNGDTGYDDNATDGWSYDFNNAHFGELEITVTAMDKKELMSEPDTMTIEVYSLGIL